MTAFDFDLVTIGAGSGGVRASRVAASLGARTAVIEAGDLGGTCVNVGCIPKKLMVIASHFRDDLADAREYGWNVPEASFDWPTFLVRKNREIRRLNEVYSRLLGDAGVEIITGRARITGANTIEVTRDDGGARVVTAEHLLIATGGHPVVPSVPGAELCIVSDDVFHLPALPKRIVVVGGGYIAIELACILHGLGVHVTLLSRSSMLLRGFDDDARIFLLEQLRAKGLRVIGESHVVSVERTTSGLSCTLATGDALAADAVLYAIGRLPNTRGLGLESVGIETDARGAIAVDAWSRATVPGVYAIGDVTDRMALTPIAIAEGTAFARTVFGKTPTAVDYENVPTAVFATPPLASVGLTEAKAAKLHGDIDVYTSRFRPLRHTLTQSPERAFMKLVVERATDRVLGVHVVAADAPEIIQAIAVAVRLGVTKAQLDSTIALHPTTAEELVLMRSKRQE